MANIQAVIEHLCTLAVRANETDLDLRGSCLRYTCRIVPLKMSLLLKMGGGKIVPADRDLVDELLDKAVQASNNGSLSDDDALVIGQLTDQIVKKVENSQKNPRHTAYLPRAIRART